MFSPNEKANWKWHWAGGHQRTRALVTLPDPESQNTESLPAQGPPLCLHACEMETKGVPSDGRGGIQRTGLGMHFKTHR